LNTRRAFIASHLLPRGDSKVTRHDQELLDKQLWAVSPHPPQNGVIALTIIAVFLVGIGIGDTLSKSKQANTNYAAVFSRLAEAPP
jgi:hypothetical protein